MKSLSPKSVFPFSILAVLSTGLLYFFSTGLEGFSPLVWIAPVPVLVAAMRSTRRAAGVIAFCAFLLGNINITGYLSRIEPIGVVIGYLLLPAFAFALVVIAYRDAIIHLRHPLAFLAFPIGWTAYEYFVSMLLPHWPVAGIEYTQSSFLYPVQLAALIGISGVTFILAIVPAGVASAIHSHGKSALIPAVVAFAVLLGAMAFGRMYPAETGVAGTASIGFLSDVRAGSHPNTVPATGTWFAWLDLLGLFVLLVAVSSRLMQRSTKGNKHDVSLP